MPADLKNCMGPLWTPKLWDEINNQKFLNTNCYSYAFNYVEYGSEKLQPGEIHGKKYNSTTCKEIIKKMRNDYVNETIEDITLNEPLPKDRYKIALFIDPDKGKGKEKDKDKGKEKDNQDYHFYRQDCNGAWSHKPGTNDATNQDANGDAITNPEESDRNYKKQCEMGDSNECGEEHNYSLFCGYFSIPLNSSYGPVTRFIERQGGESNNKSNNKSKNKSNNTN